MKRGRRSWGQVLVVCVSVVAGCAAAGPSSAAAVEITEFPNALKSAFAGITNGPEGNLWFTGKGSIGRITSAGAITPFSEGLNPESSANDIVAGSDGNLWFSDQGTTKAVGRITPAGVVKEFTEGLGAGSAPGPMVLGADGNVWFIDEGRNEIGRVTTTGAITEFPLAANSKPNDLTAGPDGNIWFTDQGNTRAIGRVTRAGTVNQFPITEASAFPTTITAGADGNVWFSDVGPTPAIGRVTPEGTITEFTTGLDSPSAPDALTAGPDGNVWFVDQENGKRAIGRVTPAGAITEFAAGLNQTSLPDDITAAADGNLWVEQSMPGGVARITPGGTITQFTSGIDPLAGSDSDAIIEGPEGNPWFSALGEHPVIGKVDLQLAKPASGGGGTTTTTSTPTTTPPPATVKPPSVYLLTRTTFGDQLLALTTPPPTVCTSSGNSLAVRFASTPIAGSHGTKLRFTSAALYVDRGIAHKHKSSITTNGRKKTVTKIVYSPNATLTRVPRSLALRLGALHKGSHELAVKAFYKKTVTERGRKKTVTVSKTLSTHFRVC